MPKRILYYSHNSLPIEMEEYFQRKLLEAARGIPIVSVMKNPRSDFAGSFASVNLVDQNPQCDWPSIRRQMRMGLETVEPDDTVYLAEHDVLYPASHYDDAPEDEKTLLKNRNVYFMTRNGYVGPYNNHIHSNTIAAASLLLHCIDEDVPSSSKFKSRNGYDWRFYNSENPVVDVRHGKNWTGDRIEGGVFLPSIAYWGDWRELGATIPGFVPLD